MLIREQVDRFEIRGFLGRGAVADVYLAWDPTREEEIALKVVRKESSDPEMLQAERNGVVLQDRIARVSRQVAAVHEQGEDDGLFWVVMEYVHGEDLSKALARGALPVDRALEIACQLCEMLEAFHDFSTEIGGRTVHGVVHGDLKPENIRLQDGDRVRVLDFGIAKHLSQTRRFTVNLFGSLPYTPPERLDRGIVDHHSDLWAVGVLLYLMVSGQRPFPGDTAEELERWIRQHKPPLPLPDSCPPGLRRIVYRTLAADPARRYPNAAALKSEVQALLEGRPLSDEAPAETGPAAADPSATRRTAGVLDESGSWLPPPPPPPAIPASPTGPADDHPEATRRTDRAAAAPNPAEPSPAEATRRTVAPPSMLFPEDGAPLEGEPASRPRPRRRRKVLAALAAVLLLAVLFTQVWVRGEAAEIRDVLAATSDPDLDAILARYREAEGLTLYTGIGLGAAREELREALTREAENILRGYHGDDPRSTETGWRRAYEYLQEALELDFTDLRTRARRTYARAHLDRIEAQALRSRGEREAADEKLNDAIAGFRQAARRDPDWADPYLGLTRIYAYERFDLDRLQQAVGELRRRGYPIGRRETAMLGDGFRMRGQEFQARANRVRDSDEEERFLRQAREHYEQAIDFYDEIPDYANVRANRALAERRLGEVEGRLDEVDLPGFLEKILGL